jgi:hypothetical protein
MGWLDRWKSRQEPKKKEVYPKVQTPYCDQCEKEIESLNTSIGEVIEDMGAFLYTGSEGKLYEPLYDGAICGGCGLKLCDDCQSQLLDRMVCPECGGMLNTITISRLPKVK